MRLVKAKLYLYEKIWSADDQAAVRKAHFPLFADEDDGPKWDGDGNLENWHCEQIWDLDLMPIEFIGELHDIKKVNLPTKLASVFEPRTNTVYNEHVKVAMPGIGLLQFDNVKVEYDFCTDSLRDRMKEGWRIIAVCPQPDRRRPDYVLGRVGPEE